MIDENIAIQTFADTARRYGDWACDGVKTSGESLTEPLFYVSNLYAQALSLPEREAAAEFAALYDRYAVGEQEWGQIFKGFCELPFQYYWSLFQPVADTPEEPGCGDLHDDLADIYRDLETGYRMYQDGHIDSAVFHWKIRFRAHWGRHATSALYAMHCHVTE